MDAWAASYGSSAAFICVSCAGPQLATQFGNELKLKNCHNTWVDEGDMPTWGQLGCNGFIVIDGSDAVVCQASSAYLEVNSAAFRHVETLLDALVSSRAVPKLTSGRVDASVGGACAEVRFGADADAEAEEMKRQKIEVQAPSGPVPSVKVDVLDEEHRLCEKKLGLLGRLTEPPGVGGRRKQIHEALRGLLAAYEAHFSHEESLLDEHLYAGVARGDAAGGGGFSADKGARTSHFADHEAMLGSVRKLLDSSSVDAADVLRLQLDFERHATAYDGGYADRLSAALSAAAQAKPVAVA